MKRLKESLLEYLQIALSIVLASIGLKAFLLPNGFLDGGATGISILIGEFIPIELSYILPVISLPFLILGWFTVSKRIVVKSAISIAILSLVIHFETFEAITDDKLLIAIFGGIFLGAGIGLGIKNGSVLDGSEILGIFLNERFGLPIGNVILMFNTVLFTITAFFISVEVALYSVLTFIVTGKVIDFVFIGFEDYVSLMIIGEHSKEIQRALIQEAGIGMTIIKGAQGFGSRGELDNVDIVHAVLNRIDSKRVYRIINQVDENAFIIELDVNNVKGGVLRKYLSKKNTKKLSPTIYQKHIQNEKTSS
ncbi:MAG: YitT family protein [Flavobacteriales bacterium]|nr:YitT family protein [Flavobacteriales bacterium]